MTDEFYTVITGASRGIGMAFALEMASRGRNLILQSLPGEGLPSLRDDIIRKSAVKVEIFESDLTEDEGPASFYAFIKSRLFAVNFLINNAGIGFDGCLEAHNTECIERMIRLNVRAVTLMTYYLIPDLKATKEAYIVNIGSTGGYVPTANKSVYLSTKSYIYFFTRAISEELRGSSVKASVIIPGPVRTNPKVIERIEASGMLGKVSSLDPDELAKKAIPKVLRGKKVIIEGGISRLYFAFTMIMPEFVTFSILRKVFKNRTYQP